MTKSQISDQLILNHQKFTRYITLLDNDSFLFSLNGIKWTAGQQAEHIYRSVMPLKMLLSLPRWLSGYFFKKANRPSVSYEELVAKYHRKLEQGGKASGRFVPGTVELNQKQALSDRVNQTVLKLIDALEKFSEEELDKWVLPHPLLGRITLREMMYFTIYHVQHHHVATENNLRIGQFLFD